MRKSPVSMLEAIVQLMGDRVMSAEGVDHALLAAGVWDQEACQNPRAYVASVLAAAKWPDGAKIFEIVSRGRYRVANRPPTDAMRALAFEYRSGQSVLARLDEPYNAADRMSPTEETGLRMPDQRSVTDQLRDLIPVADKMGMYDAADHLRRVVERAIEAKLTSH